MLVFGGVFVSVFMKVVFCVSFFKDESMNEVF